MIKLYKKKLAILDKKKNRKFKGVYVFVNIFFFFFCKE